MKMKIQRPCRDEQTNHTHWSWQYGRLFFLLDQYHFYYYLEHRKKRRDKNFVDFVEKNDPIALVQKKRVHNLNFFLFKIFNNNSKKGILWMVILFIFFYFFENFHTFFSTVVQCKFELVNWLCACVCVFILFHIHSVNCYFTGFFSENFLTCTCSTYTQREKYRFEWTVCSTVSVQRERKKNDELVRVTQQTPNNMEKKIPG